MCKVYNDDEDRQQIHFAQKSSIEPIKSTSLCISILLHSVNLINRKIALTHSCVVNELSCRYFLEFPTQSQLKRGTVEIKNIGSKKLK